MLRGVAGFKEGRSVTSLKVHHVKEKNISTIGIEETEARKHRGCRAWQRYLMLYIYIIYMYAA
jgi:hypothetical protein